MDLLDFIWSGFITLFFTLGIVTVVLIGWFGYLVVRDILIPGYRRLKRLFVNI